MSTRSERLANTATNAATSATNAVTNAVNVSAANALSEMYEVAMEAFAAVNRVHTLIKERAPSDEGSRAAIASVIQVSWAIEDAHEFKMRQLMGDKGEQVLAGHHAFMKDLRTLTKEAEDMADVFSQHATLSPSLLRTATHLGTNVVKSFYMN